MKDKEKAMLRRMRDKEIELARNASEAWELKVVPIVVVNEQSELSVELMPKDYTINELMWAISHEDID